MRQPTFFGVGCFVLGFVARLLLRPSDDVRQFVGDGLLAAFVVLYSQSLQQFVEYRVFADVLLNFENQSFAVRARNFQRVVNGGQLFRLIGVLKHDIDHRPYNLRYISNLCRHNSVFVMILEL